MARYVVRVRSPLAPGIAFAYMADLTNFPRWDPGVAACRAGGRGPAGTDATYDVSVSGMRTPMRYVTNEFEPPTRVVVQARARFLTSLDAIAVAPEGAGSLVAYNARLTLNGPLASPTAARARVPPRRGTGRGRAGPRARQRTRRPRRERVTRRGNPAPVGRASIGSRRGRTAGGHADRRRGLRPVGTAHPLLARAHGSQRVRADRVADHLVGGRAGRRASRSSVGGRTSVRSCTIAPSRPVVAASLALVGQLDQLRVVRHPRAGHRDHVGYFLSPIGLVLAGVVVYHEPLRYAQRAALGSPGRGRVLGGRLRRAAGVRPAHGRDLDRLRDAQEVGAAPEAREPRRGMPGAVPLAVLVLVGMQAFGPGSLHGASAAGARARPAHAAW